MSIADHFDHTPDVSFVRRYDASSARRQFQLSLVLMIALAAAAFMLGALIRFDDATANAGPVTLQPPPAAKPAPHRPTSVGTDYAGTLVRVHG